MDITARFLNQYVSVTARRLSRMAWACTLILILVSIESLPITASVPDSNAVTGPAISDESSSWRATARTAPFDRASFSRLPLRFEAYNESAPGQFLARAGNCNIHLKATEAALIEQANAGAGRLGCGADLGLPRNAESLQANEQLPEPRRDRAAPRTAHLAATASSTTIIRMRLIGANPRAGMAGEGAAATRTNYFIGNDPKRWRTNLPAYSRVKAEQVYRGIDIIYYGSGQQLEYDFKLAPGADFRAIRLRFAGARRVRVDHTGDLLIETPLGILRHHQPVAYQQINGARKEVAARYEINRRGEVTFELQRYDKHLPLVIDPVVSYATYFGSLTGNDVLRAVALDAAGNAYVVGWTGASDFPVTPGVLQPIRRGLNTFIAKLNPAGTALVYATYLGGSREDDGANIAVDPQGRIYVTGITNSTDFPTTANAFESQWPGGTRHLFVARLNSTGTALDYATYLGKKNENVAVSGIAVDGTGQATVAGYTDSPRFPVTAGALQTKSGGSFDAFVARLSRDGSALVYATYLGGDSDDGATCLALDAAGNAYIAGDTYSTNFPTTPQAYQRTKTENHVNFVAKLSATGDRLAYSTLLGGDASIQDIRGIAVDLTGNAYVTGQTLSANWPTTAGALQTVAGGSGDAFVTKLNATGSALVYSTFLGGSGTDYGYAIAVDGLGQAHVTGSTFSVDFPLMKPLQSRKPGGPLFKSSDGGSSWEEVPAPFSGLSALAVDPQSSSTLYAATQSDIVKSTDGGASFHVILPGVSGTPVIDPLRSARLYVFSGHRLYDSTDGGANWRRTDFVIPSFNAFSALAIDPKTPDTLYLAARQFGIPDAAGVHPLDTLPDVVFKSTDGGTSWAPLSFGTSEFSVEYLAIDPQVPATLYAATASRGLLKSTDGGANWFRPTATPFYILRVLVDPTNSATLYATRFAGFNNGVLKSTDGGTSWNPTALQNTYLNYLVSDPKTPSTVYAVGFTALYQTTDGGTSWRVILDTISTAGVAVDPQQPSTLYTPSTATSDAFIAKLNAAGTALIYSTYMGGITTDLAYSLVADEFGNAYIAGISRSPDFPVTPGAYRTQHPQGDIGFVARISDPAPLHVTSAAIKGKQLRVSGEGFDQGAAIVIDDTEIETQNDGATPSLLLISRRGGKQIGRGQTVTIRVRNADGALSNELVFTRSSQ